MNLEFKELLKVCFRKNWFSCVSTPAPRRFDFCTVDVGAHLAGAAGERPHGARAPGSSSAGPPRSAGRGRLARGPAREPGRVGGAARPDGGPDLQRGRLC